MGMHRTWLDFPLMAENLNCWRRNFLFSCYTLSGRIGKVVTSHAEVARAIRAEAALINTMHEALREYCPWGCGCDWSIGFTVSGAIIRRWLWSTATRSSPLGYFRRLLQVVDNRPHICGRRFSTGRLKNIEDFTFYLLPGDNHCLSLTRIQFHAPKVIPFTNHAEVTVQGLWNCNSNAWHFN